MQLIQSYFCLDSPISRGLISPICFRLSCCVPTMCFESVQRFSQGCLEMSDGE